MDILNTLVMVLMFFIVLYIGLAIVGWLLSTTGMGQSQYDAKKSRKGPASKSTDYNYTCSIWVFVKDWKYRYGSTKTILSKGGGSPLITLGGQDNSLSVSVGHSGSKEGFSGSPKPRMSTISYDKGKGAEHKPRPEHDASTSGAQQVYHCGAAKPPSPSSSGGGASSGSCVIPNFPLQTWVNVVVSVYGKTVDVFINGKLQKSCRLPSVAAPSHGPMTVTPNGGFSGYTAKAEYWPSGSNPEQAYMIYLGGPGVPSQGGSGESYRVKVSFLENGKDEGSFEF